MLFIEIISASFSTFPLIVESWQRKLRLAFDECHLNPTEWSTPKALSSYVI